MFLIKMIKTLYYSVEPKSKFYECSAFSNDE